MSKYLCLVAAVIVLAMSSDASARGRRGYYQPTYQQPVYQQPAQLQVQPVVYQQSTTPTSSPTQVATAIIAASPYSAQGKAETMARTQSMQHLGGGFGGGSFEGVGMNSTREGAITGSCFWGQRTPIEIGAAQGANGMWYAAVFYR